MLKKNTKRAVIYSSSEAEIRSAGQRFPFRGRMLLEALGGKTTVKATVNKAHKKLALPCTLAVSRGTHLLELGENSYRGALVVTAQKERSISLINVLEVEDYLRGVVPLEIGRLKRAEIEATKAQAVAARTYTYKRMAENVLNNFDLLPTVSDQVYGGANAEHQVSDMAVLATRDMIMVYDESIINAFYHSTCGGKTANVEDVWGMDTYPYLRSIEDTDSEGKAFCSWSSVFSWNETWSKDLLSSIMEQYSYEAKLPKRYSGALISIKIKNRFQCGRVQSCDIVTSSGSYASGGDRIRFLMRRNTKKRPILRSSRFDIKQTGNKITVSGSGYGHGVGMCQVGAIGRARSGQSFEQILKAYYSGVDIRTAADSKP